MRAIFTTVALLGSCAPQAPVAPGEVPISQAGSLPLEIDGATRPPIADGDLCGGVVALSDKLLTRIKESRPPARILEALDRCYSRLGRLPELVRFYATTIEHHGDDPDLRFKLGRTYLSLADTEAAMKHFDAVLAGHPRHTDTLFFSGLVHANNVDEDPTAKGRAAALWRRLLEADPNYSGSGRIGAAEIRRQLAGWGTMMPRKDPTPTSAPTIEPAAASPPQPASRPVTPPAPAATPPKDQQLARLLLRGSAELAGRRYKTAIQRFEEALVVDPQEPRALHGLGAALWRSGDLAGALGILSKAAKRHPEDVALARELRWAQTRAEAVNGKAEPGPTVNAASPSPGTTSEYGGAPREAETGAANPAQGP